MEDLTLDPLGFRRESLLEFTTQDTLRRIQEKYPEKIPNIPGRDEWDPLEIHRAVLQARIHDVIKNDRKRERKSPKMDIIDLRCSHRIEAYVWILGDDEALEQFENPREFMGEAMFRFFVERYGFIEA